MLRFDVITLFPDLFEPFRRLGIVRRAFDQGLMALHPWNPRDQVHDAYRRVDDRPYGGGPGMVMMLEPLERSLAAAQAARGTKAPVVLFSPAGRPLDQARVERFAEGEGAVLVCGRYEGIDQRFIDRHVDEELSLGDFVLSGGELPALALVDAVARLLPGVLGDADSHRQDSFSTGLLDCPHYSRPEHADPAGRPGHDGVPAVLLGGNHGEIARWRREQALALTAARRPELIEAARAAGRLDARDVSCLKSLGYNGRL